MSKKSKTKKKEQEKKTSLSSINLKIFLPTIEYDLFYLEVDPRSVQAKMAIECKAEARPLELKMHNVLDDMLAFEDILRNDQRYQELSESCSQNTMLPLLKVTNQGSETTEWLNDPLQITDVLDQAYPRMNDLTPVSQYPKIVNNAQLWQNFFRSTFEKAYWIMLMHNNSEKLNVKGKTPWDNGYIAKFKRTKVAIIQAEFKSLAQAYLWANTEMLENILPTLEGYLANNKNQYMVSNTVNTADLTFYAYIRCLKGLKEENILDECTSINAMYEKMQEVFDVEELDEEENPENSYNMKIVSVN